MDERKEALLKEEEVADEDEVMRSSTSEDSVEKTDPISSHLSLTVAAAPAGSPLNEGHPQFPTDSVLQEKPLALGRTSTSSHGSQAPVSSDRPPSQTESDRDRQFRAAAAETERSTPKEEDRPHHQLLLLPQEAAVAETHVDQVTAALSLRRDVHQDNKDSPHVAVEMETFHRSSTRRDSFIQAIESGDVGGSDRGSGASVRWDMDFEDTTTHGASPDTIDRTGSDESFPEVEELDIFMKDKTDLWHSIQQQCRGRRKWVMCGTALVMLAVVTAIILIPQSLVYVEYYQMALARSRLTGRVDRGRTLYSGCYLFSPDTDLVLFKSTAYHVQSRLEVSTCDGLAVGLHLSLQYFIKGEELGQLHKTYGDQYEHVIRAIIESEVKNSVVTLTLDQYRLHRATVERLIHQRLAVILQGDCCPVHCLNSTTLSSADSQNSSAVFSADTISDSEVLPANKTNCTSSCNPSPNCTQGLHVRLLPQHVQLGAIEIPKEVSERFLRFTLLQVEAEKEALLQESVVERKTTELLTKDIKNQAHEELEAARWAGRRVRLESEAEAELRHQRAYSQAMRRLLSGLNVTAMDQRLQILLLLAYREVEQPLFFEPLGGLGLLGGLGSV